MPIRTTPPPPLPPVPFQIPAAFETTLPNGLRVVIFDDERLPLVSFRLAFLSGDAHDPKGHTGLTSAMVSMMTEGTDDYSSRELAEKIERLGASLNVSASDDFTIVSASTLSMYSGDILDLIAEVVFQPTFPEEELDLYRRNTVENLKYQRSQPNFLANEQTSRILYGSHPYGTIAPKAKDIENLQRGDLVKLHAARLIPNNAVLVVVGNVDREELLKKLEGHFGEWPKGEAPAVALPTLTFSKSEKSAPLPPDKVILEVAEENNVDIDYSCRVGICGVCRIKKTSGEVSMEVQEGLQPGDKENAIILACQAKSTGNVTVEA